MCLIHVLVSCYKHACFFLYVQHLLNNSLRKFGSKRLEDRRYNDFHFKFYRKHSAYIKLLYLYSKK